MGNQIEIVNNDLNFWTTNCICFSFPGYQKKSKLKFFSKAQDLRSVGTEATKWMIGSLLIETFFKNDGYIRY